MSQRLLHSLRHCDDCGSEHLNAPCGMTLIQRLRSVTIHNDALPTRDKNQYWDDRPLQEVFGLDAKERKEEMLEDSKGHGFIDTPDQLTDRAAKDFGLI